MREFNFKDTAKAEIRIDGKVYSFDPYDAEMLNELAKVGKKVKSVDRKKAPTAVLLTLSKEIRNSIGVILGKEAQDEIFANRKPNILEEVRLLNEIHKAREESDADAELQRLLADIDTETVDG